MFLEPFFTICLVFTLLLFFAVTRIMRSVPTHYLVVSLPSCLRWTWTTKSRLWSIFQSFVCFLCLDMSARSGSAILPRPLRGGARFWRVPCSRQSLQSLVRLIPFNGRRLTS